MSSARINIEVDRADLARQLAEWSNEEVLEFIKDVDTHKADWDFIHTLKPWIDEEHRKMVREELEVKAHREGRCQSAEGFMAHVSPHKGCILQ